MAAAIQVTDSPGDGTVGIGTYRSLLEGGQGGPGSAVDNASSTARDCPADERHAPETAFVVAPGPATRLSFFDMAPLDSSPATTVGLHVFDLLLRVLSVLLAAGTMAAVPLLALFLTGRGPIAVSAQLEPPYSIGLYDDRVLEITHFRRPSGYVNFAIGEESKYLKASPRVVADVRVGTDDTDTRVVISAAAVALLTIAWSGVMSLWRVVRSARAGNPFSTRNVIRLRWLAGSVLAMPLVAEIATRLIDRTLDVDPPVSVMTPGPGWPALLIVGLGLVALSEVFGSGSVLRQFEEETI